MQIRPQLARTFEDGKDDWMWGSLLVIAEEKLDGIRAIVYQGDSGNRVISRIGTDRSNNVTWLRDLQLPKGVILDGELFGGESSNQVGSLMSSDPDKLSFVVFDCMALGDRDLKKLSLMERRKQLETVVSGIDDKRISMSKWYREGKDKRALFSKAEKEGKEGIMLKQIDKPYEENSRKTWIKVKTWIDVDVVIVDCEAECSKWTVRPNHVGTDGKLYPEGKLSSTFLKGYVGLTYGYYIDGKLTKIGSLGRTGLKEDIEKFVGKIAVVKTYGLYESGALRHPVWKGKTRDDKKPEDCTFEDAIREVGGKDRLIKMLENGGGKNGKSN